MTDQTLNRWMDQQRSDIDAARAADRSREAGLLNYAGDQRAKVAAGTYAPSPEWSPVRTPLYDGIQKLRGIAPDNETPEPAPHVVEGEFDKETEDRLRADAWASLDPETQEAGLDPDGVGFADAAEAFSTAVDQAFAGERAEQVAFRDSLKAENMRNDPGSYGR